MLLGEFGVDVYWCVICEWIYEGGYDVKRVGRGVF